MVSRNTTLVPSLGLRIGPACEAGLSIGMRRERVPTQKDKDKDNMTTIYLTKDIQEPETVHIISIQQYTRWQSSSLLGGCGFRTSLSHGANKWITQRPNHAPSCCGGTDRRQRSSSRLWLWLWPWK